MSDMNDDGSVIFTFDHDMKQSTIGLNDVAISITSDILVKFDWTATFPDKKIFVINLNIHSALQGGETLNIRMANYKAFRSPTGGCVVPESFSITLKSSLESAAAIAKAASIYLQYIIMGGMIGTFGFLMILGGSLEMVWSLLNTMQLISYLPLMVPYYPDHVKIMFEILEFTNMDIEFISDLFKQFIAIDELSLPSYNSRFLDNGIGSPLFLEN